MIRLLPAIAAAAILAPSPAAASQPRMALSLEGTFSRHPQKPRLAAGGRLSARLSFAEALLAADGAMREPSGEIGYAASVLVGAGLAHDLAPLVSLHAHALAGPYYLRLRDYVYGGWRLHDERAWGGQLGLRLHPPSALGRAGRRIWPLAGLWVAVLRVRQGSDRLRAAEWGGTLVLITLTLGAEITGPARHALPVR